MTKKRGSLAISLTVLALLLMIAFAQVATARTPKASPPEAFNDTVLQWNQHALTALSNPPTAPVPGAGQPPQVAILHLAMAQGAMYDAVTMIAGGYSTYNEGLPIADRSASKAAAAATAAHRVLIGLAIQPAFTPEVVGRLDGLWDDSIATLLATDGPARVEAGIAAGETAAAAMLAARADDGRYVPYTITPGDVPGQWIPTPPTNSVDPFAWVGFVDPFMLESPSQFRSKGPHALSSGIYAEELNEVKRLGGPSEGSQRTAAQEAVARFFTVNPLEMYNRAFRALAEERQLSTAEQARLFAMLNMAGADALINCFNDKAHWNFWRPITAIRNADLDGNPKTVADPTWTPMIATPPYSEHASGYNCVTAAFMHTAEAFFGHGPSTFTLVRLQPDTPAVTRTYARFTDVIDDTIDARVYQGVHFRAADVQGAKIGKDVAGWATKHLFQRTNSSGLEMYVMGAQ